MPLTDTKVRNAKPAPRTRRLFDQSGLYLEISPSGGKWWRLKYRFDGLTEDGTPKRREKRLAIGVYPDVPLKLARERRDEARSLLAQGIDPGTHRKAEKQAQAERGGNSFEVIAREWFARQAPGWAESHSGRVLRALERDVFPWLGNQPIASILPGDLLKVMRRIESRGATETAHRILRNCSMIFRYGVATGRCDSDPTRDLRGALAPSIKGNFAAATEPDELRGILRGLYGYRGTLIVQCALRLAPLLFVRPGELRKAEWKDFDLNKAEWRHTVTKSGKAHIVPLATQAVEILRELHPLTGRGRYVFPSARSRKRSMSDNAVLSAMRRSDISKEQMTGHGFRAAARTILDEVLHFPADVIEHQLAHNVRDPLGRAYNRTTKLDERRRMMQKWADYLDGLISESKVIVGNFESLAG